MTVRALPNPKAQLTLDFEPGVTERYPTAMDCLRAAVYASPRPVKTIAADMDLSASTLSRKLNQDPDDPRRFSLDDLEHYIKATGDTAVVEYLAVKYLQSDEHRRQQALNTANRLLSELAPLLAALKGAA
jgi:hypothetical protein